MLLGELIIKLERADQARVVPYGFARPTRYRNDELAFEPALDVTVASMLTSARGAVGATYASEKEIGAQFSVTEQTRVWLAYYGEEGETLGQVLVAYMLDGER